MTLTRCPNNITEDRFLVVMISKNKASDSSAATAAIAAQTLIPAQAVSQPPTEAQPPAVVAPSLSSVERESTEVSVRTSDQTTSNVVPDRFQGQDPRTEQRPNQLPHGSNEYLKEAISTAVKKTFNREDGLARELHLDGVRRLRSI